VIPAKPDNINRTTKKENRKMAKCGAKTEIYSRVCGYFRPVSNWNKGKKEEFKDRKTYEVSSCSCKTSVQK
jgi:anaerobic ribonucleoside-triphosphate reductase